MLRPKGEVAGSLVSRRTWGQMGIEREDLREHCSRVFRGEEGIYQGWQKKRSQYGELFGRECGSESDRVSWKK